MAMHPILYVPHLYYKKTKGPETESMGRRRGGYDKR